MDNTAGTGSLNVRSQSHNPHRHRYLSRSEASTAVLLLMKFVIPSLLVVITLKYQGHTDILFKKKPIPIWCFLGSTCVYWVIEGAMKQIPTLDGIRLQIIRNAAIASGVLSPISLLSILLPHQLCFVPIIAWTPLFVLLLMWPLRHGMYELIRNGMTSVIDHVHAAVDWATGREEGEEEEEGASSAV